MPIKRVERQSDEFYESARHPTIFSSRGLSKQLRERLQAYYGGSRRRHSQVPEEESDEANCEESETPPEPPNPSDQDGDTV